MYNGVLSHDIHCVFKKDVQDLINIINSYAVFFRVVAGCGQKVTLLKSSTRGCKGHILYGKAFLVRYLFPTYFSTWPPRYLGGNDFLNITASKVDASLI